MLQACAYTTISTLSFFGGAERAVTERDFPQLEGRPVGAFPFRTGIVANVKVGLGKI